MSCQAIGRLAFATAFALALSGCGGAGSMGTASIPSPPPAPPPPPPPPPPPANAKVDIFQSPVTQEFATATAGAPLRIRYDAAADRYEIMAGNLDWQLLVDDPQSEPLPGNPNVSFKVAGSTRSFFMIRAHYSYPPDYQYRYSNLAVWAVSPDDKSGFSGITAFGMPTAAAAVPLAGTAAYQGMIEGGSTFQCACGWDGETTSAYVGGSVSLTFDFGKGALTGALHPYLDANQRYDLGTITFANTVFGVGSQNFSGEFATKVPGPNSFSGLFTGPNAEELIGKWTFPFASPTDASPQSAVGAMIAKRP